MNPDYFKTIYDYNYAAHRRLWDCIMHITDEQFVQDVNYSIGSIRNHMVHLFGVDDRWLARLQGTAVPAAPNAADYPTRQAVRAQYDQVEAAMLGYIATLTEGQLNEIVHFDMPHRGGAKSNPRWQILAHVVNHGTDHRSQVLPVLHRLGAPTFEQDLMIYIWDK